MELSCSCESWRWFFVVIPCLFCRDSIHENHFVPSNCTISHGRCFEELPSTRFKFWCGWKMPQFYIVRVKDSQKKYKTGVWHLAPENLTKPTQRSRPGSRQSRLPTAPWFFWGAEKTRCKKTLVGSRVPTWQLQKRRQKTITSAVGSTGEFSPLN